VSKNPKRADRRPVIVTLCGPGADADDCVAALRALREVRLHSTTSPEAAAAAVREERAALAVVASGSPEAWVEALLAATAAASPPVPLLVLVAAGQPTPARWTRAGVATLQVPSSVLALARTVTLLLEERAVHAAP
jgi:NAD(P)-dependent dehydrogenase (short-subunit alcohol dehydrogenase family)